MSCVRRFILCAMVGLSALGCNKSAPERLAIQGTITLQGRPLQMGSIVLLPKRSTKGPSSGGTVVNGQFDIPASAGPGKGSYEAKISAVMPELGKERKQGRLEQKRSPRIKTFDLEVEFASDDGDLRWEL